MKPVCKCSASGVFEVQQSLPMVMTSDLAYATTNHDLEPSGHVIDASEIQFQTEDGQMVDPRQQLYVIQQVHRAQNFEATIKFLNL